MRKSLKNYIEIRVIILLVFMVFISQKILAIDYNIAVSFDVQDEHGPKINSVIIEPINISLGDLLSITANITDTNKVSNVTVLIQNSSHNLSTIPLVNQSGSIWNATWNSTNASKGIYYITILAYDNLSNKREFDHSGIIGINISALRAYSNNSIELKQTNITTINAYNQANTYLGIISDIDIRQSSVTIAYSEENLFNAEVSGKYCLGKYIDILVSDSINNNLSQANIRLFYQDSDYSALGLDETTLQLYFWNTTEWTVCESTGVDTINNFVWANVTHLSAFAIFGAKPVITTSQPSGGGGGGFFGKILKAIEEITKKEDKQDKEKDVEPQEETNGKEVGKPELLISQDIEEKSADEKKQAVPLQTNLAQIIIYLLILFAITFHIFKISKQQKSVLPADKKPKLKVICLKFIHNALSVKNNFVRLFNKIFPLHDRSFLKRLRKDSTQKPKLSPKYYIYLENGIVIKNLEDLLTVIKNIDRTTFKRHINDKKNYFAYWVKDVLGDEELANRLFKARTKRKIVKILENEFK